MSAAALRVAVLDDDPPAAETATDWGLLPDGAEVDFVHERLGGADQLGARLAGCDVVVAMRERTAFDDAVLAALPRLRLLVTTGMANSAVDLPAATARGITVCGTASPPTAPAELTWALLLALARRVPAAERALLAGRRWQPLVGVGLHGKVLGVVGLGRIGSAVADVGRAFGMRVVSWSQNLDARAAAERGVEAVTKDELFAGSDVVTLHLRLSARTRHVVGAAELRAMRPSALLVNTARAGLVDTGALLAALDGGWIAGAALDVFDDEPLPAGSPLLGRDDVVLTPHLGYATDDHWALYYGQAVEDVAAWARGEPVRVLSGPRGS